MKVVLLNGSPRKGNSLEILLKVEKYLHEKQIDTEIINLNDFNIKYCIGCYKCVLVGQEKCSLKDDLPQIWKKIIDADGVVLASPVYTLSVPGILKNFMDRVGYAAHRPEMYNKPALILSTTSGIGTRIVIMQLKWFELVGLNIVASKGFLVFPTGKDRSKVAAKKDKDIEKLVAKLESKLNTKKLQKPSLIQVISFNVFKLKSTFGKDAYRADYEYYKDKTYHINIKINPIKKLFGKIVFKLGMIALSKSIIKK